MGNTETMKLTRTEPVGWTGKTTRELRRTARQRKQRDCAIVGVCAKGTKKELNTLDEADFVRDVANRDYHYLYRFEIAGAKRILNRPAPIRHKFSSDSGANETPEPTL